MEQTETKQFDRWFKGSKVINADGTPKVMYRGGGEDISVFDRKKSKASNLYGRGFYFTDSEAHAKQYGEARSYYLHIANPLNAESGAKNITPKQMRAFLEAVAEDEDYGLENYGYGASVDSVLKALKGKSDFDALQDINATAIGDFVAAIELFNEVNGTNYDGIITPTETVVFDSKQIKSATDNVGLFDPDNPNVKFSMRETVEETRDLLAVHNLTEENMRGALELGGLAMPSIAVVKAEQGHSQYGPISAIFDKGTIDPKASSANEIYGGDAWTPTFPQVEYEVAEEVEKRISDKYYEISEKYGNSAARPLYAYATDLENTVNRSGGVERIIEKMKSDTSVMQAYLADSGQQMVEPVVKTTVKRMPASQVAMYDSMIKKLGEETMRSFETPKGESPISYRRAWMDEHGEAVKQAYIETLMDELALDENIASEAAKDTKAMKRTLLDAYRYMKNGPETREEVTDYEATDEAIRAAVDSKAYEEWLNGLFAGAVKGKGIRNDKSLFTPSGNRRSFAATHWDVTLDNVVRAMRSEEKTGVGSIGGRNIEGAAVKQYSSIKDMKADSDRLQTIDQDEYDAMRKGFRDRFSAIARDYAGDGDWFDAGDVLVEAVTKHQTADGIYKYISKYADLYKPSKQVADDLYALVEEMKNAPTGYFEAKPRRAIGFDEIAAVIVPDNLSDDVRTALVDAGVNMIEYEAGNEADRLDKMNGEAVSTLKFSLRETDSNVQESLATEEELFAATHGHRMTEEEAVKMAKKLKKIAHSDMDTNVLAKKLMDLYDYAERGTKISIEAFDTMKNALAEEIMATSKTLDMEHEERMQPIRDYFRNKPIQLTSEQQREAANLVGSLGEYRKMVFGRIRLGQKGTRLDTLWGELTDLDAELFPADASESEMAKLLLDAVDAMAPVYQNASGMNAMESHQWLAGEMNRLYFAQKGVKASVKEQREFGMKLEQYEQVMDRFQDEHKKLFNEAMAKANASMDEEKAQLVQQAEQQRRLDRLEAEADASKYAKEQIASVEAKTAAEMEAYRTALKLKDKEWREKYRANAKETSRKQRYRAQIARIVNDLTKKLEKPTDKKHIKAGLDEAVLEFLQELDLGSKNKTTRNLSDRIRKLTEALNEAKNGTENGSDTQYLIDPDLLEELKELTKKVEGIGSLPELNADQMREMRNAVRDVAHIVTTADKMFAMQKSMTAAQAGQQTIEELSHKKDKKQRQGATAMVDEMVNTAQLDSFRFFDRVGTTGREVFQGVRDGFDEKVRCVSEANDYVQEHTKDLDKDIVKGEKAKKTTFEVTGGRIKLTKAQVMELYCLNKRDQARMHLYNGGIRTKEAADPVKVTEADVKKITDTLSTTERRVADALQLFMAKNCAEWGNQTSMTLYGRRKFGEKNYYPITVDKNTTKTMQTEEGQGENLWAILNMGMTKSLKENANNALMIGDIFDTFSNHVDSMSTYRAFAAPIADMLRWYNYSGVKTMLERKLGAKSRDYIPTLIRDLNGQNKAGYSPGFLEAMTQRSKSSSVGANISVAIQQPTAIARAADMMSPKYIAEGVTLSKRQMKESVQLAQKYCQIAKWKSMGFYETHMGKGLRDTMFGGDTRQGLVEMSMALAGKADEITWGALWRACEKETQATMKELQVGSEAYYQHVGKRLSEIIDYTQVVDTPLHRSQLMRSKNYGSQMITAFMSEPTKTYNMLYAAISQYAENRRDPVARAKVGRMMLVYTVSATLTAVAKSAWEAVRDDEEEEWLEKFRKALLGDYEDAETVGDYLKEGLSSNLIGGLNPLGMLPLANDILDMMQGYDPSRMDMQAIQKLIDVFYQIGKAFRGESTWSAWKWIRSIASPLSYGTGLPAENFIREIYSIYNTVSMALGGDPLPMQTEAATADIAYDNMYDALLDGNQKKWKRIEGKIKAWEKPKSNSDIDGGIGKLLAEDDERIAKAWEAKAAGKASEVQRIRQEMVNELAKSGVLGTERLGEIVDKAINTYGNKVTPKEEKPVDTEEPLKVNMYATKDAANAVRGIADGTTSLADAKAIMSELVADSEAEDPATEVRGNVLGIVKKDYVEAVKNGDTKKANSLGKAMKDALNVTNVEMNGWMKESYREDLKSAVDTGNTTSAQKAVTKMRAYGADDYSIKRSLDNRYADLYEQAVKSGNRTKANQIKRTLMSLGLKYKDGGPMYKDSTFEGWLK